MNEQNVSGKFRHLYFEFIGLLFGSDLARLGDNGVNYENVIWEYL
jgi:hypothetical protein